MINEIERGAPCPHWDHARHSDTVARDPKTGACIHCLARIAEGRLSFGTEHINPIWRGRFLEFWSLVEVGSPDECWPWRGQSDRVSLGARGRHKGSTRVSPLRAAFMYTWGDPGTRRIRRMCNNPSCCNPLHMRALGIPHAAEITQADKRRIMPMTGMLIGHRNAFVNACHEHAPRRFRRLQNEAADGWFAFVHED